MAIPVEYGLRVLLERFFERELEVIIRNAARGAVKAALVGSVSAAAGYYVHKILKGNDEAAKDELQKQVQEAVLARQDEIQKHALDAAHEYLDSVMEHDWTDFIPIVGEIKFANEVRRLFFTDECKDVINTAVKKKTLQIANEELAKV